VAEARALQDGFKVALQAVYNQLIIEGYNKVVIQALDRAIQIPWSIQCIIKNILNWRDQGVTFTIKHILREPNMAADWFSKFCHSLVGSFSIDLCFSLDLRVIFGDDVVGRTLMRRGI